MRSTPKTVSGGAWRDLDLPYIVIGGVWRRVQQAWTVSGGNWAPIWDLISLPQNWQNSNHISGRYGSIAGTIWGDTVVNTYWDLPTVKRVVGVVIDITLGSPQGSWHGSGGKFAAGQTWPSDWSWEAPPWEGVRTSTVLPCNFAPGERITVWIYGGGSDRGDGKSLWNLVLRDVIYG